MPSVEKMLGTFDANECAQPIDVHLVGGYLDESGLSLGMKKLKK